MDEVEQGQKEIEKERVRDGTRWTENKGKGADVYGAS